MPLPAYPEKWDGIGPLLAPTFLRSRFHRDGTALWDWFPPSRCGYLLKARERGRFGGDECGMGTSGLDLGSGKKRGAAPPIHFRNGEGLAIVSRLTLSLSVSEAAG